MAAKATVRVKRYLALTAFGAMGPSYRNGGCATRLGNQRRLL
jgi:hypothetical protein